MKINVFRDVTPYSLVDLYGNSGGTCCLNIQHRGIETYSGNKTTLTYICIVIHVYFIVVLTARTRTFCNTTQQDAKHKDSLLSIVFLSPCMLSNGASRHLFNAISHE
jgi:uncharacterized membrane protein